MTDERIEDLLREANALKSESLAIQREALSMQKEALAAQREIVAQTKANLELARGVNEGAALLQKRARVVLVFVVPVIVLLIGYLTWLLLFRLKF